jgi:hypothetical protein
MKQIEELVDSDIQENNSLGDKKSYPPFFYSKLSSSLYSCFFRKKKQDFQKKEK